MRRGVSGKLILADDVVAVVVVICSKSQSRGTGNQINLIIPYMYIEHVAALIIAKRYISCSISLMAILLLCPIYVSFTHIPSTHLSILC